ncbi:endonuclease III [Candidatus Endowatersipora endosymbiont of Watersipora subatra]|uniref:endonuclease III n=1 Tax=Candidatus Endowatersipora endosymbiont of Watersipora subatra TaxID=3077946 RepID=UPI00312C7423
MVKIRSLLKSTPHDRYTHDEIVEIFRRFRIQRPNPKSELHHINSFTLLVAVVLSAQSTDIGVNNVTQELFKIADNPQRMLALGESRIRDIIKTVGLYRRKAKNITFLSYQLVKNHNSVVPQDVESLTSLVGVGHKTANVVMSIAFGYATLAVDTHIFRISNRLDLAPGKNPATVEVLLKKQIPEEFLYHAHQWLILHGRYICKARKPKCKDCIIADLCKSKEKTCNIPASIIPLEH